MAVDLLSVLQLGVSSFTWRNDSLREHFANRGFQYDVIPMKGGPMGVKGSAAFLANVGAQLINESEIVEKYFYTRINSVRVICGKSTRRSPCEIVKTGNYTRIDFYQHSIGLSVLQRLDEVFEEDVRSLPVFRELADLIAFEIGRSFASEINPAELVAIVGAFNSQHIFAQSFADIVSHKSSNRKVELLIRDRLWR